MLETYESEQRKLKERREVLQSSIEQAEEAYSNVENFASLIRKYTDIQELDAFILNSLIDRIVVHEKVTLADLCYNIIGKGVGAMKKLKIYLDTSVIRHMDAHDTPEKMYDTHRF